MGNARSAFDDHFEFDRFGAALGAFHRRSQRVDGIDVFGAADLGDHKHVETVARLFEKIHHITIPVRRVERVDAHRQRLVAPVDIADRFDDVLTCLILVVRRNRILEIEVDDIRIACCHLWRQFRVRTRSEKLASVQAGRRGRLEAEGHEGSLAK